MTPSGSPLLKAMALAVACALAAPLATAQADPSGSDGELSVTLVRGERDCDDAFVTGTGLSEPEGTIAIYAGGEDAPEEPIFEERFQAEAEGDGFRLEAGPYEVDEGLYYAVVTYDDEESMPLFVPFFGDCGEEDAIERTCVEYALAFELADGPREFEDRLCIEGAQPDDCLVYHLFIVLEGASYVDEQDFCAEDDDEPPVEEDCLAYALAISVNGEAPFLTLPADCGEPPESCFAFFSLAILVGEVPYIFADGGPEEPTEECSFMPTCEGLDVTAATGDDGSITLSWDVEGAASAEIWRDGELIANATTSPFVDTDTEAGVTYQYDVVFLDEEGIPFHGTCVEVTAVPFFGTPLLGAIAGVGAIGAYAWMRRRA